MTPSPYCKSERIARKVLDKSGLSIFMWDSEWTEFAAFAREGAGITPQNIRGLLKRMLREKGYQLEILEAELTLPADTEPTGVTFRFAKMPADQLPQEKKVKVQPAPPLILPQYSPPTQTKQLQLELL